MSRHEIPAHWNEQLHELLTRPELATTAAELLEDAWRDLHALLRQPLLPCGLRMHASAWEYDLRRARELMAKLVEGPDAARRLMLGGDILSVATRVSFERHETRVVDQHEQDAVDALDSLEWKLHTAGRLSRIVEWAAEYTGGGGAPPWAPCVLRVPSGEESTHDSQDVGDV